MRRVVSTIALCLAVSLLPMGCMFRALRKDVERLGELALIGGQVSRPMDDRAPIVVGLVEGNPATVVDTFVLDKPGGYFFVAPAGTYRVVAFSDTNGDLTYQPGIEPAATYGAPDDVVVVAGQKRAGVDLHLRVALDSTLPFAITARALGVRGTEALPTIEVGQVTTLDDPRFSAENGELGLWQPVEFLFRVGAGFYFLEPYDPHKTPVLFVHGAGGHPDEFRALVARLDRKRFQPWMAYYPSGLRVGLIAGGVARWVEALQARFGFRRIVIVAHSMGGLVARAAINRLTANGEGELVPLFVSISTPWNGHAAAARGVEKAPVVMPMWVDFAPGSPFLTSLFETPLPQGCPHHLLFSYNGHSRFLDEPNDGVVAISSELRWEAQQGATRVYGFDESHTSILRSDPVSETLNGLLRSLAS